jgi:hypothetical protein
LSTLPRSGRIAWYCLSRASFAEPPRSRLRQEHLAARHVVGFAVGQLARQHRDAGALLLLDLLRRLHPRQRLRDRELGDALAVVDVRVEPHFERVLHDLRDELQRIAARELLLDLALELRIENARGQHVAQLGRHVLGLQPHAARQQAVMVDERLHRFEEPERMPASCVPPAAVGMRLT